MAERQLAGKDFFLYRGNAEVDTETFDIFACSESSGINQSNSDLSAETNCGIIKLPGTANSSIDFSIIPVLSPDADKVPVLTLQADFNDKSFHNYKITTGTATAGNPIWSFRGYVKDLNWNFAASDFFKGSGSIQVDGDGITMTLAS